MQLGPSFSQLRTWFLQGIALLAPLIITIAFLVWLGRSVEVLVGDLLRQILPGGWYVPGMGLVAGVLITLAAGLLANLFLVRWLLNVAERIVDRIPVVKSLFQGLKDISRLFARNGEQRLGRPVAVDIEGIRLVGFVTQEPAGLPGDSDADRDSQIAVFLPMSYQMGGYTLYLDRSRVRPLNVGIEQAMRAVLTGGSIGPAQSRRAASESVGQSENR
jgi:uncharacterized membrane protein